MFDLQLLYVNRDGYSLYSPWMERQGDLMALILSMDQFLGAPTLKLDVFHKNSDETGDGTATGATITVAASVVPGSTIASGLKELVRYKFTVLPSTESGTDGDWCLFRVLDPTWFDAAS
jgi:hypothetical protein